jgi:hypothetical protein
MGSDVSHKHGEGCAGLQPRGSSKAIGLAVFEFLAAAEVPLLAMARMLVMVCLTQQTLYGRRRSHI